MKSEKPKEPMVFMKPSSSMIKNKEAIILPEISQEVHHEVELVFLIGKDGKNIPKEKAYEHILGLGIGLDLTLRDLQKEAKAKGKPWTVSKGFDTSAPVSEFINKNRFKSFDNLDFHLVVNGEVRQKGNSKDMIFKIDEIISYLSSVFTLQRGDLIFTGTPQGVSQIKSNDKLTAVLDHYVSLDVYVK